VEKVQIIESCLNERVLNWPMHMLSVIRYQQEAGQVVRQKETFHKILTYSDNLWYFSKEL